VRFLEGLPLEKAWLAAAVLAWDERQHLLSRDAIMYRHAVRRVLGLSHLDHAAWDSVGWRSELDLDQLRPASLVATGIQGSLIRHDRLSRPEGIDSLAPYISAEAIRVATRMPRELLFQERSKPVLRALCDRYLPPEISKMEKAGFEVPWGEWLMGPLRPLVEDAEETLATFPLLPKGFFRTALRSGDREGVWSGLSLFFLLKEFSGLETPSLVSPK
jgi:hypothetical protein